MLRLITEEARDRILELAADQNIYVTGAGSWGDPDLPFYIFESWADVEALYKIASANITGSDLEELTLDQFEELKPTRNHDIDWIVGADWGFSDQFTTCSHCNCAIQIDDPYRMYWLDQITGDYLCCNCIRGDQGWQEEYLAYCAQSWTHNEGISEEIADPFFADPAKFGYTRLNSWEDVEEGEGADHIDFPSSLQYANDEELKRLYKAQRAIDPDLLLLTQRGKYGSSYVLWAKFPDIDDQTDRFNTSPSTLEYAMGRIFAKYRNLTTSTLVHSAQRR